MQQKTHDFLVRMQVPMATFGGDLMEKRLISLFMKCGIIVLSH